MKKFSALCVLVMMMSLGGIAAAADVSVSEPFPKGSVLNPVDSTDTIIFGDVQVKLDSIDTDDTGNRTVQVRITNNSRTSLWVEPAHFTSFAEGRFHDDGKSEGGDEYFRVVSMATDTGRADIAYEYYMAINAGGSGTVTIEIDADVEEMCFQPFASNTANLMDDSVNRIHGCWLLGSR